MACRRHQQQQKATAAAMTSSVTSSGSNVTDATRVYDRRLTGSAALGHFEPATSDDIWSSSASSSAQNVTSSTPTTSSSSAQPPHSDLSPDDEHRQRLHRSSPLTALNSIYVIDDHVTGNTPPRSGVVNGGFVGDGILTDSWRRVSWRARLRAGIARSTISSDPGPTSTDRLTGARSHGRRPSYLSDVIDSVAFFSNAGGNASTHARCEFPLSMARCQSDGGEWTLRRDHARPTGRPSSLVSNRNDHPRHKFVDAYYTYDKDGHRNEARTVERV